MPKEMPRPRQTSVPDLTRRAAISCQSETLPKQKLARVMTALSLLFLTSVGATQAQGYFFEGSENVFGWSEARDVLMADLDVDGDLDVVAVSFDEEVAWFENTLGDASAFTKHVITEDGTAEALDIGDVDSDGVPDIVVAFAGANKVALFKRGSTGSTSWAETLVSGSRPGLSDVKFADVDIDGDLDVVFTDDIDQVVAWSENANGLGTSWSIQNELFGNGVSRVEVVDLDLDGDPDFLITERDASRVRLYTNDGGGTSWTSSILATVTSVWGLGAGDVDGDGDVDFIVGSLGFDDVLLFENDGQSPASFTSRTIDDDFDAPREIKLFDVDRDGDLDAVAVASFEGEIRVYENKGRPAPGSSVDWRMWTVSNSVDDSRSFDAGDLDGDGDMDFVATSPSLSSSLLWWRSAFPHARFEDLDGDLSSPLAQPVNGGDFEAMAFGDIDGDGHLDVVAGGTEPIAWWTGPESANPGVRTAVETGISNAHPDIEIVDFDGDGDQDIVATREACTCKIEWWENLGGGASWAQRNVGNNSNTEALVELEVADLFGTGETTVILAGPRATNSIAAYRPPFNSTGGTFVSLGRHGTNALRVADLDGDGDQDVISGGSNLNPQDAGLRVMEQSAGVFSNQDLSETVIDDLEVIDWDRDGDLDIIAVNENPGQILFFENPGAGFAFVENDITPPIFPDGPQSYTEVLVGDFDHDGIPDLWALNREEATFSDAVAFSVESGALTSGYRELSLSVDPESRLSRADINHDGDADLVFLDATTQAVTWTSVGGPHFELRGSVGVAAMSVEEENHFASLRLVNQSESGERDMELGHVFFDLESIPADWPDSPGTALSPSEVEDLAERIRIFLDDGDGLAEPDEDTLLVDTSSFTFEGGALRLDIPPGVTATSPAVTSPSLHFLLTPKPIVSAGDRYGVFLRELPGIVHADSRAPIQKGTFPLLRNVFVLLSPVLFTDDFESGNLGQWSAQVP